MITEQAQHILERILKEISGGGKAITLGQALEAFRKFSETAFDCAEDLLLWETGLFDLGEGPRFLCALVRQFSIEADGEYDHMEQLHLELYFDAAQLPPDAAMILWSSDCGDSFPAFLAAVEQTPPYRLLASAPSLACEIYFEEL